MPILMSATILSNLLTGNSSDCPPPGNALDETICVDLGKCKSGECVPFCEWKMDLRSCACNGEFSLLVCFLWTNASFGPWVRALLLGFSPQPGPWPLKMDSWSYRAKDSLPRNIWHKYGCNRESGPQCTHSPLSTELHVFLDLLFKKQSYPELRTELRTEGKPSLFFLE